MNFIPETELILNSDGSVYHLNLLPHQIAHDIITVGDPDRVNMVTKHFDKVIHKVQKREFHTQTGEFNGKPITVISTGIGTDNIDIVLNELDALVNIDLTKRIEKSNKTQLNFYRIGTSGALQSDIAVDSLLLSKHAIGFDSLMEYYQYQLTAEEKILKDKIETNFKLPKCNYLSTCSKQLLDKFSAGFLSGITVTAPGFYGPQGRSIRLQTNKTELMENLILAPLDNIRVTNLEMETAGIYALAKLLGHNAISCNALLANRATKEFSKNPKQTMEKLIEKVLEVI